MVERDNGLLNGAILEVFVGTAFLLTLRLFHFSMYNNSFITQPALMLYVGCCIAYFSLG